MMDSLITIFGDKASFDGKTMSYWPSSETIAKSAVEDLMAKAKLGYRAKNLTAIAEALDQGFPSMDDLWIMAPEDAKKKLRTLRGIGNYSAELVMPRRGFRLMFGAPKFSVSYFMARDLAIHGKPYLL
jgi:3-methyladenine DNA glycosylase/8-oxoguanine DNA glycosylase